MGKLYDVSRIERPSGSENPGQSAVAVPVVPENPGQSVVPAVPENPGQSIVPAVPENPGRTVESAVAVPDEDTAAALEELREMVEGQEEALQDFIDEQETALEDQKQDYLEMMEGYCGLNTGMLLSTRESIRKELLKLEIDRRLFSFESLKDYPTVEDRRKRLPFEDDYLFDLVIDALGKWREGELPLDEAYAEIRYALDHPAEMKALAEGKEEEEG